ncbi:hypothetical protein AA18889_2292 [Acetobacter senegalensis DSM 18889]|nr:hypothetical protein AA18889_2292 [Acetobacter senegalensis DSM 18889]
MLWFVLLVIGICGNAFLWLHRYIWSTCWASQKLRNAHAQNVRLIRGGWIIWVVAVVICGLEQNQSQTPEMQIPIAIS